MAHRGYIAKVERNGSGRYIYLGHASYPSTSGIMLLEHYQDPGKVDALLNLSSIYPDEDHSWSDCRPATFSGGTDAFFLVPYLPAPEWLYCWTRDGWFAAPVRNNDMPRDHYERLATMTPADFQNWFDHNQAPHWIAWRARSLETQQPQPLSTVIKQYAAEMAAREAAVKAAKQEGQTV